MKLKFRSFLVAVCGAALLSACESDSTGPDAEVSGSYALVTVGGYELPVAIEGVDEENHTQVISGTLVMRVDGTFTNEVFFRHVVDGVGEVLPEESSGTYTVTGSTIHFSPLAGPAFEGRYFGSTGSITQNVEGFELVYQR